LKAGADDYLAKPFDFNLLDARLRHVAGRADAVGALSRQYAELDARVARRAMELGETREALTQMQRDRAQLLSSIQVLHEEINRLSSARA
jgi:two-component system response regulator MprA